MSKQSFHYGGQAVIEGIMIRGERYYSLAVRKMNGSIHREAELLERLISMNKGPMTNEMVLRIFQEIIDTLKNLQK